MLDPPPARGKTLRKRKQNRQTDRVDAGCARTGITPALPRLLSPACRADQLPPSAKAELALWRAFLADEIDAILLDKD